VWQRSGFSRLSHFKGSIKVAVIVHPSTYGPAFESQIDGVILRNVSKETSIEINSQGVKDIKEFPGFIIGVDDDFWVGYQSPRS
jgi:hypothetical protein